MKTGRTNFSTIFVIDISLLFYIIILLIFYSFPADVFFLFINANSRSIWVSGKLPTYPSPEPTLTLTSHLGQNVGLGEG